jgi:transcriptional regulator with XRE-family HTH domain
MAHDPIDVHVGFRIRLCRKSQGISQDTLAHHIGLTFQQVQKYENGANRVSSSMLWRIADCLGEPISYFFEGLEGKTGRDAASFERRAAEAALMMPAMLNITKLDRKQRAAISDLILSMVPSEGLIAAE